MVLLCCSERKFLHFFKSNTVCPLLFSRAIVSCLCARSCYCLFFVCCGCLIGDPVFSFVRVGRDFGTQKANESTANDARSVHEAWCVMHLVFWGNDLRSIGCQRGIVNGINRLIDFLSRVINGINRLSHCINESFDGIYHIIVGFICALNTLFG